MFHFAFDLEAQNFWWRQIEREKTFLSWNRPILRFLSKMVLFGGQILGQLLWPYSTHPSWQNVSFLMVKMDQNFCSWVRVKLTKIRFLYQFLKIRGFRDFLARTGEFRLGLTSFSRFSPKCQKLSKNAVSQKCEFLGVHSKGQILKIFTLKILTKMKIFEKKFSFLKNVVHHFNVFREERTHARLLGTFPDRAKWPFSFFNLLSSS